MISDRHAESILLSIATEDDFGLYEAIWLLNSRFPEESLAEKYRAAMAALRELHRRGLIRFVQGPADETGSGVVVIDAVEVDTLLQNPVSWYPEYDGTRVVFTAAPAGEEAYRPRRWDA